MYNLLSNQAKIYFNEPMAKHTTFRIGGMAEVLIIPNDCNDIKTIIKNSKKIFVIGNGSNLLVNDKGIDGVVLKIANCLSDVEITADTIICGSGLSLTKLATIAQQNGLTGMEWAYGIPGTVGGAITMNAGAYGGEMSNVVVETEYIDYNGDMHTINKEKHEFDYRKSVFNTGRLTGIITKCKIKLHYGDKEIILKNMEENMSKRKEKQPLEYPSAGSTFKRPEGHFVGQMLEELGLKGFRVGDAGISEKHAGFVINLGNATAEEVKELIKIVQKKVYEKFGVMLEPEVKMV